MAPIEVLKQQIITITDALNTLRVDQKYDIDAKLTELSGVLVTMGSGAKKELGTQIDSAAIAINKHVSTSEVARSAITVVESIRTELRNLRSSINPAQTITDQEDDEGVILPFLKNAGDGIASGAASAWAVAKQAGGTIKANALFVHKKFILPGITAVMEFFGVKNMQMPPVALHARSIFLNTIGSFLPKATRDAMQKSLDEEFAFHAITGETKALVANLNTVRAGKIPPETSITFDFENQLPQFSLLSDAERKGIPRKVLAMVKKGVTAITFDMLIDEPSGEKKVDTGETEVSPASEAITASDLPTSSVNLSTLQNEGIEVKGQKLKMKSNPAVISYNGRRWAMQHKDSFKANLSTFSIDKANWNGSQLDITVTGTPNAAAIAATYFGSFFGLSETAKAQRASGAISKDQMVTFLEHIRTGSSDYVLRKPNGEATDAVLHLA